MGKKNNDCADCILCKLVRMSNTELVDEYNKLDDPPILPCVEFGDLEHRLCGRPNEFHIELRSLKKRVKNVLLLSHEQARWSIRPVTKDKKKRDPGLIYVNLSKDGPVTNDMPMICYGIVRVVLGSTELARLRPAAYTCSDPVLLSLLPTYMSQIGVDFFPLRYKSNNAILDGIAMSVCACAHSLRRGSRDARAKEKGKTDHSEEYGYIPTRWLTCAGCMTWQVRQQLKVCKCERVYYCDVECQKLDWKKHKVVCGAVTGPRVSKKEVGKVTRDRQSDEEEARNMVKQVFDNAYNVVYN